MLEASPGGRASGPSLAPALLAIGIITAARLAYNAWPSPYELIADETQYWDRSRRLSASYCSRGSGVAWLIAIGTRLFGTPEGPCGCRRLWRSVSVPRGSPSSPAHFAARFSRPRPEPPASRAEGE